MRAKGADEIVLLITVLIAFLLSPMILLTANAEIPGKINYQGYLTDPIGMPVDGTVPMTLSIYDVDTGGSPLWTETQDVSVTNGIYNVSLGAIKPVPLVFDVPYYLGVKVGFDLEMTPRKPLTSLPYAFRAKTVEVDQDTLGNLLCSIGHVPQWNGSAWVCANITEATNTAGTGLTLSSNQFSVVLSYQLPQTCSNNQVAKWNGSQWVCASDNDTVYTAGPGLS